MSEVFEQAIEDALREIARTRPLFHSEADLQLELGMALRTREVGMQVRLEVPASSLGLTPDRREAIDMVLRLGGATCLVELKYPKATFTADVDGERYALAAAPRDVGRHGFLKDVARLEKHAGTYPGIALMLTNDRSLWREPSWSYTDEQFQVHEGRRVTGHLDWSEATAATTRKQYGPIVLRGTYDLHWKPYALEPCEVRQVLVAVR